MKKIKRLLLLIIYLITFWYMLVTTSLATDAKVNDDLNIYSPSCILMETSTGTILYEKNANEIRYPASTTKIMTAILALENCNLNDVATVSHNAIFSVPARIFPC